MVERHFAFFRQDTGVYIREWKGPVSVPPTWIIRLGWAWLLNRWATRVSQPQRGEIGLDVTRIGWPVGDFCYCWFDLIDRRLEWGPPRHYIEVSLKTLDVIANQETHRPLRAAVPGQAVIDITGTTLEPYHGSIYGRFVRMNGGWTLQPAQSIPAATQRALESARVDLDLSEAETVHVKEAVSV